MTSRFPSSLLYLFAAVLALFPCQTALAAPAPQKISLGVQPLGYPVAMITAVMKRDQVLADAMAKRGKKVEHVPFLKGNDMVDLVGKSLAGAFLGDMPTIRTSARTGIWIVGLVKQTFSSVVARKITMVKELAGRSVGYAEGSSAHHTLLQGLKAAGLSEKDVRLVPVTVSDMPDALASGKIDAYAAWEPAPTISLTRDPATRILYRGISTDYFVLSREFEAKHPEEALLITASFIRACNWMRADRRHLREAAQWSLADYEAYSGKVPSFSVDQVMDIALKEILSIPSAPAIPTLAKNKPRLAEEFLFLKQSGKLADNSTLEQLQGAFAWGGLARVLSSPKAYHLKEYRYR